MRLVNLSVGRRNLMIGGGLCALVVASTSPLILDNPAWSTGLEQASNVLGLLEQRSPGGRTAGELIKTKRARHGVAMPRANERVKSAVAKAVPLGAARPLPDQPVFAWGGPGLELGPAAVPSGWILGEGVPAGSSGGAGYFLPAVLAVGGGGTGGGANAGPGGTTGGGAGAGGSHGSGGGPLVVTPEVPEPDTWATMLLGMGLCGFALRRRKPSAAPRSLCAEA